MVSSTTDIDQLNKKTSARNSKMSINKKMNKSHANTSPKSLHKTTTPKSNKKKSQKLTHKRNQTIDNGIYYTDNTDD